MLVKKINASSKRTNDAIKNAFVELVDEKKFLDNITVTELVKKAGITRSAFYTHYSSIYDIIKDLEDDAYSNFFKDGFTINTIDDVIAYIDTTIIYLKENENSFRKILSSNDSIIFMEKFRNQTVDRIMNAFSESSDIDLDKLKLDVEFLVDGIVSQFVKYFRLPNYYSLDIIAERVKEWAKKLFF